jgi:hypothetical protein
MMSKFATTSISRRIVRLSAIVWLSGVALSSSLAADAPRPDFAPNPGVGWVVLSRTFLPPPSGPGPVMDDPAHRGGTNDDFRNSGAQPTFPIADLANPILQPWVREKLKEHNDRVLAGRPAFAARASCWPTGVPAFLLFPIMPIFIIQGRKEVVMVWQADNQQIRRIYLTDKHSQNVKPSWYGDSIGHYEGDTLVVDTVGIDTRTVVDDFETPHTDKLHVVERWRLRDSGMVLEVNFRVEDSGAFTTPWNAIQRYRRMEPGIAENNDPFSAILSSTRAGPMLEAICAENSTAHFVNDIQPIPQASKPDF